MLRENAKEVGRVVSSIEAERQEQGPARMNRALESFCRDNPDHPLAKNAAASRTRRSRRTGTLRGDLIQIAAGLLKIVPPTEMDQIDWCVTTSMTERWRVLDENRRTADALRKFAIRLKEATKLIPPNVKEQRMDDE